MMSCKALLPSFYGSVTSRDFNRRFLFLDFKGLLLSISPSEVDNKYNITERLNKISSPLSENIYLRELYLFFFQIGSH